MTPERWQQIKDVLSAALRLGADERATYLTELQSKDPELHKEVEAFLAYTPSDGFLEQPAVPSLPLAPGTRLRSYEIESRLGQGGMGAVFLAKDRSLDRRVALKFLSDDLRQNTTARRRFLREAKAAAALDHPYICKIYETGEDEDRAFIAMEYVRGETLQRRLAAEPLAVKDAVRIATEVAEALETAHSETIVHRDLKPSNIMLSVGGHVKVLDFGLAKRMEQAGDADAATASELTQDGTVRGTVAYMSPEQLRGRAVDSRSDIFSFGIVLYEMLAGAHPFRTASSLETAAAIFNVTPLPLRRHRADIPALLEHIVSKMLAKAPTDRYQLVHDVRTDLARVKEFDDWNGAAVGRAARVPTPVAAKPQATPGAAVNRPLARLVQPFARTRALWAGLAVVAALALFAAGTWWWTTPGVPTGDRLAVAVLPLRNVSADPFESDYLADGISRAVITRLTQVGLRVTPWETALTYRGSRDPTEQIARELNVAAVLVGTFQLSGERMLTTLSLVEADTGLQSWADQFEEPYDNLFDVQSRIAVGAATSLRQELTGEAAAALAVPESVNLDAYDFYLQGAHILQEGSQESTEVAFQYFTRAVELDPALSEAHVGLGAVYWMRWVSGWGGGRGSLDLAERSFDAALRLNPASMRARRGLVNVNYGRGLAEACLLQGQEAARIGRADDLETLLARAQAYQLAGLSDLSLPMFRRIMSLDPMNEASYFFAMIATLEAGELDETIAIGNAYLQRFGADANALSQLATAYHFSGDADRAREYFERAIEFATRPSRELTTLATVYDMRALMGAGSFYDQIGRRDLAEATWRRGVALVRPKLETDPDNTNIRSTLASLQGFLGEREASLSEVARVFEVTDPNASEHVELAAGLAALGETERAVALLREYGQPGRSAFLEIRSADAVPAVAGHARVRDLSPRIRECGRAAATALRPGELAGLGILRLS